MKKIILVLLVSIGVCQANAQLDSRKKSGFAIPATEAPKADPKVAPKTDEPKKEEKLQLNAPNVVGELNIPEREFSMFPQEEFGNPAEQYSKRLKKIEKGLLPEGHGSNVGLKEDAYWGDYHTNSNSIRILYRDHSAIDGDLLTVLVDDDVLRSGVYLTQGYKGFTLNLKEGLNKIDFYAVNTGASGPNTAEYKIVDENNAIISKRVWALEAGVKVTIVVVKD